MRLHLTTDLQLSSPSDWDSASLLHWFRRVCLRASNGFFAVREGIGAVIRSISVSTPRFEQEAGQEAPAESRNANTKLQVARLQHNDTEAWEELVRDWTPKLFGYLRNHVPTREDAQDLLSETFAAAVKSISKFDGNAALSTWLYTLAHNKMVDFWRRTRIEFELPISLTVAEDEVSLDFRQAFARLPLLSRNVLNLRYVQGLGVDEIAKVLNRTYKATESLLGRSRAMLKDTLEEAGIGVAS